MRYDDSALELLEATTPQGTSICSGHLSQNYPNPFNPETQIPYQLPEAGEVSLAIYNTLGQQVRVLMDEKQEAGYYRVTRDGRDARGRRVSSGIYLVRMAAGEFSEVRKMVVLK